MSNDLAFIHRFEPGNRLEATPLLLLHGTGRDMVPLAQPPKPDLARKPVLITSGQRDPIIPASNAAELAGQLTHVRANVQHSLLPAGHELTQLDVTLAKEWMKTALLPEAVTSSD